MAAFAIDKEKLFQVNEEKDNEGLAGLGGLEGVAQRLQCDLKNGLASDAVERHRHEFGANTFKEVPPRSFFSILFETLKDRTLILLMAAATVSTVLGAGIPAEREHNAWIEGVAIWVAVIIVSMVGSVQDYSKDLIMVKVVRDGKEQLVGNHELVVGDVMKLDTGDKIVADGIEIEGHGLIIDEASLTGESDPIKKSPDGDFWCRSGTQVREALHIIPNND
jgi:P-type Ca2+ transporter type 2C